MDIADAARTQHGVLTRAQALGYGLSERQIDYRLSAQEWIRLLFTYLEDETYRRQISRQLNKGETLHALRQFIFFANAGQIRHQRPEDQTNQALCLNLVTNLVAVWNTVYVDKAIEHLTQHGLINDQDDLSKTSPTQRAHINPYVRYTFHNEQAHDSLRPLHKPERTFPA